MLILTLVVLSYRSVGIFRRAVEMAPLKEKLDGLKVEIKRAQETLSVIGADIKSKQQELASANATIADGERWDKWLKDHDAEIKAKTAISEKIKDEISALSDTLKGLNEDYKKKQGELQTLAGQVAGLEAQLDGANGLRTQVSNLEGKIKTYTAQVKDLEKEKARLDKLVADLSAMEERYNKMKEELEKWKKTKGKLETEVSDLKLERDNLNQEIGAKSKFSQWKTEHAVKSAELDELKRQVQAETQTRDNVKKETHKAQKDYIDAAARLAATEATLTKQEGELAKVDVDIESARKELERLKKEVDDETIRRCWQDLYSGIPNIIRKGRSHKDERKWMEEFKENLKNANILFPERTLLAFHTSMKVQDSSPMAVLAGISGTGKSLLPELYAHALGMNFLQVAVQPRWDSPQDMLGFYNYMECRFKATPLSRLLWSADLYNNRDWAHHSMNLVLLDEMNLARVEYYFSDMLSKLEVRRGINPENENERLAAEIELESGAGMDRKRLFIGANTLFVGTMNEDESTQSLSDKVLDRANVIRFGKPAKLDAKPDKQQFLKCYGDRMFTLDAWRKWGRNTGAGSRLSEPMQAINDILARLGRPFGHRVWQSIQAYISSYPGSADDHSAFQHALADQIEMKILPKLNGLDKQQDSNVGNALNELSQKVEQHTQDSGLCNALNAVINDSGNAFFQWKGVTR